MCSKCVLAENKEKKTLNVYNNKIDVNRKRMENARENKCRKIKREKLFM